MDELAGDVSGSRIKIRPTVAIMFKSSRARNEADAVSVKYTTPDVHLLSKPTWTASGSLPCIKSVSELSCRPRSELIGALSLRSMSFDVRATPGLLVKLVPAKNSGMPKKLALNTPVF